MFDLCALLAHFLDDLLELATYVRFVDLPLTPHAELDVLNVLVAILLQHGQLDLRCLDNCRQVVEIALAGTGLAHFLQLG